jgi:hypothetical protein
MCDLIVLPARGAARYYEEVPVDYALEGHIGRSAEFYTVTLEYGKPAEDPFATMRNPDPDQAQSSTFLHPIIRRYSGAELASSCHLLENLGGVWSGDEHVLPLLAFIRNHTPVASGHPAYAMKSDALGAAR